MKAKQHSTKFKPSIFALYNERRSQPVIRDELHVMQKKVACHKEESEVLQIAALLLGKHHK